MPSRLTPILDTAISADGTRIAFWRSGSGLPLLLVHGATADHTTTWRVVLPALEERFAVCAMDRRGRGDSGDSASYELAREAEDIVAVLEAMGEPAFVLGHSFGALGAIEASLRTSLMRRLILYEGVPVRGAEQYAPGVIERLEALIASGDIEGALVALLREVAGMDDAEIDVLRGQTTAWERRIRNSRSAPRELRADASYVFDPGRFASMATPTMLLVGGASSPRERANARAVASVLPNGSVTVLDGQQHIAMHTAPELFVQEVERFLTR